MFCKFPIAPNTSVGRDLRPLDYFDRSLSGLSKDHLIDLLMLHPSITIHALLRADVIRGSKVVADRTVTAFSCR
jgi:hypothetical protein